MKKRLVSFLLTGMLFPVLAHAGEADLEVPDLGQSTFFNGAVNGWQLLFYGMIIVLFGLLFG
jgi:K(+)-stimulated pyrophosphate-energized sodium pump